MPPWAAQSSLSKCTNIASWALSCCMTIPFRNVRGGGAGCGPPADATRHRRSGPCGRCRGTREVRDESFLRHDVHRVVDVDENRRLEERAAEGTSRAARHGASALVDRVSNLALDDLELRHARESPDIGVVAATILALAQSSDPLDDACDEVVVNLCFHVNPFDRDACLAGIEQRAPDDA